MSKNVARCKKKLSGRPRGILKHPPKNNNKKQIPNVQVLKKRIPRGRKCQNCVKDVHANYETTYYDLATPRKHSREEHNDFLTWICIVCGIAFKKKAWKEHHEAACRGFFC